MKQLNELIEQLLRFFVAFVIAMLIGYVVLATIAYVEIQINRNSPADDYESVG